MATVDHVYSSIRALSVAAEIVHGEEWLVAFPSLRRLQAEVPMPSLDFSVVQRIHATRPQIALKTCDYSEYTADDACSLDLDAGLTIRWDRASSCCQLWVPLSEICDVFPDLKWIQLHNMYIWEMNVAHAHLERLILHDCVDYWGHKTVWQLPALQELQISWCCCYTNSSLMVFFRSDVIRVLDVSRCAACQRR